VPKKKTPQVEPELKVPDLYEAQLDEARRRLIKNALKVAGSPDAAAGLYHTNPVRFLMDCYRLGIIKDEPEGENEDADRRSDADAGEELLDRSGAASRDEGLGGSEPDGDGDDD
jgi:hypothetical protein